jgi:hypothetical protein
MRGLHKRTKSPTSKAFCFTFLSLHAFVSVWYLYKLISALSLSDFSRSLSLALVAQNVASGIVHVLLCLISSGVIALAPNKRQKGEKFVALDIDIL